VVDSFSDQVILRFERGRQFVHLAYFEGSKRCFILNELLDYFGLNSWESFIPKVSEMLFVLLQGSHKIHHGENNLFLLKS